MKAGQNVLVPTVDGTQAMVKLIKPLISHRDAIQALFANYPYKQYQQIAQRLDRKLLSEFMLEGFLRHLDSGGAQTALATRGEEIVGLASLIPDPWHSTIYNIPMGKISHFVSYYDPREISSALLDFILAEARRQDIRHLAVRFDANEWDNIHLFEQKGFYLVDCSVKMSLALPCEQPGDVPKIALFPYDQRYKDALMHIAATSHQYNHYYSDPALPTGATNRLFSAWVEKCCDQLGKHVFVAQHDSATIGFAIFLANERLYQKLGVRIGILDFMVVGKEHQGKGLGRAILAHSLRQLESQYDYVELRTCHTNYPALSLYAKFGFRIVAADILLHQYTQPPATEG
jgi:GNAT superfamily N-acetyltransferase